MYNPEATEPSDEDNDKQSSNYHFVSHAARESVEHLEPQNPEEIYGFAQPAVSRPQRAVWLPRDSLGLAEEEEKACQEAGVDASVGPDAVMDEKGKVDVTGPPPDIRALMDQDQ